MFDPDFIISDDYLISQQRKRSIYPPDYKLQIIEETKISGSIRKTAKDHGLDHSTILYWKKNEMKIKKALMTDRKKYK